VGASGWDYRAPYAGSVAATLIAVQEQVLLGDEYIWPWESFDPEEVDEVPRPSSLADLNAAKQIEMFWEEGTHSILDMDRVIDAGAGAGAGADDDDAGADDDAEFGAIRPLSPAELSEVFGSPQPSAADFERVYQPGPSGPLGELMAERWTGRSLVIYKDGTPAEVHFWGFSGD
jgi:hypothetical protein